MARELSPLLVRTARLAPWRGTIDEALGFNRILAGTISGDNVNLRTRRRCGRRELTKYRFLPSNAPMAMK